MAFPENKLVTIPATISIGARVEVRQMSDKGFDYIHDGSGATAALEGSVSGLHWDSIQVLAADAQGAVDAHYNLVRVNTTGAGALGAGTKLVVSGKVL